MKKKTQPKPTQISKHNVGYSFQVKAGNLAPLPMNVQNVRSYNPQQSLSSQATFMSSTLGPGRKTPMGRPPAPFNTMQQTMSPPSENGSFNSGQFGFSEGGLSTDGLEVYEHPNQVSRPLMHIDHHLQQMEQANLHRDKNIRSAPASMPGSVNLRPGTVHFDEMESTQLGESVSVQDFSELEWMFHAIVEPPLAATTTAPARKASAPKSRPASSLSKPSPAPTLHYDSFLLHLIDRDLEHASDVGFPEAELPEAPPELEPYYEEDDNSEDGFGIADADSGDFWSQSKSFKNASSKSFLAKGSVLALIDDHKHDTSVKHTRSAGEDFFRSVSKKAAAVGLDEMADKLAPRSRKAQFTQFPGSEVLTFSDDSRPASPDGKTTTRVLSGGQNVPQSGDVDWNDAFENEFEDIAFDPDKVQKSKSADSTHRVVISASSKVGRSKSRPGTADTAATYESIMEGVVDVEEASGETPFKSVKAGRRRSFSDYADAPPSPSAKGKSVKYFSYLNMNQPSQKMKKPKSGSGDDELDQVMQAARSNNNIVVHVNDPFEGMRPERRASAPLLSVSPKHAALGSGDSGDQEGVLAVKAVLPPRPVDIEPARPFSNPANDGPVWGHIPNYSRKQDFAHVHAQSHGSLTAYKASPVARARTAEPRQVRPESASAGSTKIVGYVKKFSFEGDSIKSPFLHHMTKDKHLKKYGDDQRAERASKLNPPPKEAFSSVKTSHKAPSASVKDKPLGSLSTGSLLEASRVIEPPRPEPANFDTSVPKPKNPFLRQNSWERDATQPDFNTNIPKSRRPFGQGSFSEDNTTGMFKNNKNVIQEELDNYSWDDSFGDDHSHHSHNSDEMFTSPVKSRVILSRQSSLRDRPGVLSRQTSSVNAPPPLSRQNSLSATLPPIGGSGKMLPGSGKGGVGDMQALINSINSVLVAPVPLKHNRPTDVFGRGAGGGGAAVGGGDSSNPHSHGNSIFSSNNNNDSDRSSNGRNGGMSRGNSFINANSSAFSLSRGNSFRDGPALSQSPPSVPRPAPWNRSIGSPNAFQTTIEEEQMRPESRSMEHTVSFAAGPLATSMPQSPGPGPGVFTDTMQRYVPSERRGSLMGEVEPVHETIQRRRTSIAMLTGPAAADIDKLVSARRDSILVRPTPPPQEEIVHKVVTPKALPRAKSDSLDSTFLNPLMEEYYDYEEGLQDTGVIIANLHADPLYRILREEIERQQAEDRAMHRSTPTKMLPPGAAHSTHNSVNGKNSVTSHQIKSSTKPVVRPTRSANGMSNYKTRDLGTTINPSDLKVLSTFHSLPPAAWVTCRVVYFLVLSFYECVARVGKHYEYRACLKAEPLWKALESHMTERKMCMEEVDYQYSWPVLQALLAKFPVVITRVLQAIEHGLAEDDAQSVPEFPAAVFFDAFPPTKLIYLRDLIKQGMGLFQASELIHMIPVAAQLCDWAKRVIAQVYQSCITRLRATQSNTLKGSSVLHSTVPMYNPADDTTFDSQFEEDERPATLPPNFKFVLAVEDALEESALFAMQSLDSFSNLDGSQWPALALSHTLEKGLNLVKPSDRLDLLLVPPSLRDIHSQLSMYGGSVSVNDEFGSVTQEVDSLARLQNDWLLTKHLYERHLQQYAASPLHQVILLPPPHSLYTTSNLYSDASQMEYDLQSRLDDFIQAQVSPSHLHASQSLPRSVVFNLRSKGVHPILEHSVTAAAAIGGVTLGKHTQGLPQHYHHNHPHGSEQSTQADVLITRLRDGKLPAFVQGNVLTTAGSLKIAEHESLALRFSLVLIDDQAPLHRRPLTPFSSSFPDFNGTNSVDQAVAATVGPNKYVVCIADTPNSWLAFQMICRMARPSDSIVLIHIPVITPPFGSKVHSHSQSTEESVYVTRKQYAHQRAKAQHRIEHLLAVYKSVGYNLYVDKIPTYREEMSRQLAYMQRKNFFQSHLVGKNGVSEEGWAPSLKSSKSVKYDNSGDVAVRLFVQNQHTYHLAQRILAVAQKHDPSFLVLGAEGGDILKIFTAPTTVPSMDGTTSTAETLLVSGERVSGTKNLNFPHDEVVANNARDPPALRELMSAGGKNKPEIRAEQVDQWMGQFKLYSDQRVDLVEMTLHQYSNQCAAQSSAESLRAFGHAGPETEDEKKRFSFIVSNSDCLK